MIMIIIIIINKSQETTVLVVPKTDFCHESEERKVIGRLKFDALAI